MKNKHHQNDEGFILLAALVWIAVCGLLATGLLFMARTSVNSTVQKVNSEGTFLLAQSALQKARLGIKTAFEGYFLDGEDAKTVGKLDWFKTLDAERGQIGKGDFIYEFSKILDSPDTLKEGDSASEAFRNGNYAVKVDVKDVPGDYLSFYVKITVDAEYEGDMRTAEEVVQFGLTQDQDTFAMFGERAPFLANTGGANLNVYGDIMFNEVLSGVKKMPVLYGDLYTVATTSPSYRQGGEYNSSIAWLPPYNYDGGEEHSNGYDGTSTAYTNKEPKNLPRIDDFDQYVEDGKTLNNASLSAPQHVYDLDTEQPKIITDAIPLNGVVYEGNGPDGIEGTPDDGSLVLDGRDSPIVLDGSVVVTGDLVILGEITGQGAFFVGGNIHIVSDITYKEMFDNSGSKDTSEEDLKKSNEDKDIIGFASNGSIIIGDYTAWKKNNSKPRDSIEYAGSQVPTPLAEYDEGLSTDGNAYTGTHGEKSTGTFTETTIDGEKVKSMNTEAKKYYESVVGDELISQLNATETERIDGNLVSNHLIGGAMGAGNMITGTIVARDIAIDVDGNPNFIWDSRLPYMFNELFSLGPNYMSPVELLQPTRKVWREIPYGSVEVVEREETDPVDETDSENESGGPTDEELLAEYEAQKAAEEEAARIAAAAEAARIAAEEEAARIAAEEEAAKVAAKAEAKETLDAALAAYESIDRSDYKNDNKYNRAKEEALKEYNSAKAAYDAL